ncbi:GNAT family N-acetyltransferase [Paraburkholderia aspalathi]|uniref:GNAT family N-acetyltransferase n=1 Tax=Paraburkholderia aspalathi TaxID=1324617 RepID=UPI0038B7D28E
MNLQLLDASLLRSDPEAFRMRLRDARGYLETLSDLYPSFGTWFAEKVMPGVAAGERTIVLQNISGVLSGIAVLKDTPDEQKLCCLRVLPAFQGTGAGVRLFDKSFDLLNNKAPLLSVSEEQLPAFEKIFRYFGFEYAEAYCGIYRPKKTEISFNGLLIPENNTLACN